MEKERFFQSKFVQIEKNSIFAVPFKSAEVAQLVEHDLAKVGVAGSNPVFRSERKKSRLLRDFFSSEF